MTYAEKLKDPRWEKRRIEILERDDYKCQLCGERDKMLNVHHKYYESNDPWDYVDCMLITYCEECHKKQHEAIDTIREHLVTHFLRRFHPEDILKIIAVLCSNKEQYSSNFTDGLCYAMEHWISKIEWEYNTMVANGWYWSEKDIDPDKDYDNISF